MRTVQPNPSSTLIPPMVANFPDMQVDEIVSPRINGSVVGPRNAPTGADEILQAAENEPLQQRLSFLEDHRIKPGNPPPKPVPLLKLNDSIICTQGNITNIQGQAKSAKSAVMGAMIASLVQSAGAVVTSFDPESEEDIDTLQFAGDRPEGMMILHFDTEQSPYDHYQQICRALRRVGVVDGDHEAIESFSLATAKRKSRLELIHDAIAHYGQGRVVAVFIDGAADLIDNPNDIEEATQLVEELNNMALNLDISIITVVHENAGSEVGKARGHLGSELERKAETNLRVRKDTNSISYMWVEKGRHCDIPEYEGVAFSWDDEKCMHVTRGVAGVVQKEARKMAKEEQLKSKEESAGAMLLQFVKSLSFPMSRKALNAVIADAGVAKSKATAPRSLQKAYERVVETLQDAGYITVEGSMVYAGAIPTDSDTSGG